MGNWENVELGSVCEVVRGGSPRPIIDYITDDPDGVNWLKIGDVKETDKFFTHAAERIKRSGIPKTREVHAGDLILSNSMSFGRAFITLIDGYIHDGWLRLRCNEERLDKEFLYYFLTSNLAQNQFKAVATGSVVNNLKSDTVKAVRIDLPPLEEQRRIAAMLSMIDAKIKCNEEINENLYQQLFALYDYYCNSADDSEVELGALCKFQEGYVNPAQTHPEYFDGDVKWLRAVDINESFIIETSRTLTQTGFQSAKKSAYLFSPNTIVISKSGTIGRLGIVGDYMCGNRAVINIAPKDPLLLPYIYAFLKSHQKEFPDLAVGSVQKNLYVSLLEPLPVRILAPDSLSEFCNTGNAILNAVGNNCQENIRLIQLRDTLLPRLMSGELDVSDIDL